MFDADADDDLGAAVCRDEACDLEYVHPSHLYPLQAPPRGRPKLPWWQQTAPGAHLKPDSKGLNEAIRRALLATEWPLVFREIRWSVYNDYGSVEPRAIHRHLARLISDEVILRLDLDLRAVAYIQRQSRFLADRANLRDHILGKHDQRIEKARGRGASRYSYVGAGADGGGRYFETH